MIAAALARIVGDAHVLTDPSVVDRYTIDWTNRFSGMTPAVVRPASLDEVVAVVRWCDDNGVAVVPQGGNTGLVGGGVPLDGEVVLSLTRLDAITDIDATAGQLTAAAGATIAAVQSAARDAGWDYGVDWTARDTATVGGSVATNAGGLRVLRYGDTRAQLMGIEAVLGDGSVLSHLGGLVKDNTGYHLASLLCGSEGTLGVVTAGRLRLVPRYEERVVALLAFASVDDVMTAVGALRRAVPSLEAAELFLEDGLALVCSSFALPRALASAPAYLLVECADHADPAPALAAALDTLEAAPIDIAAAVDPARRADLWRYREAHTDAINRLGAPHKLDVTLPAPAIAPFLRDVPGRIDAVVPGARTWLFGHAADGNVHVNVTGVAAGDDRVDDAVLSLTAALGGSISAEHGIGTAKRRWLHLNRSPAELAAMRAIKQALDPRGTLNPNVLLPA